MRNFVPAAIRGLLIGLVLILISLPILFALHGALRLGSPPISGLILLGLTVALTLAIANGVGAFVGETHGNPMLAAVVGFIIGVCACFVAAPLYGGVVVEGLQRDATGLVWGERGRLTDAARGVVQNTAFSSAGDAVSAAREGRLREEVASLQQKAKDATTPQARQNATEQARKLASELSPKGIAVLKSGAAKLSAFALLLWALVAPPLGAAWECKRAKR